MFHSSKHCCFTRKSFWALSAAFAVGLFAVPISLYPVVASEPTGDVQSSQDESSGQFVGRLVLEALPDGRNLRLLEPFEYVDPNGHSWEVPAGTEVDGASIPSPFWSFVGGPFSGKYRSASVIHDHYCAEEDLRKVYRWESVHKVFLDAMLTSGVDAAKANVMYAAVYQFGPRWEHCPGCKSGQGPKVYQNEFDQEAWDRLRERVEQDGVTADDIPEIARDLDGAD